MENQRKPSGFLRVWLLPIVICLSVAFIVRFWVAMPARVPSASMYPTIPAVSTEDESFILVNKLATEFQTIHRGEVVVFHWPDDPSQLFVKRVVGLPGETIEVTETAIFINGHPLHQMNQEIAKQNGEHVDTWKIPSGHYFMLGDDRPISDDSRMWKHPFVAKSAIVGQASMVLLPLRDFGHISQHL